MKKNILAMVMAVILGITGFVKWTTSANAEVISEDIDISSIFAEEALIGYAELQSRGIYLVGGYSIINKISSTKVGAGGVTEAAIRCTVKVNPILEQKKNGSWARVTSWSQTNQSALSATVSKSVTVDKSYYYRVSSYHSAASDVTSSWTDALWVN